MQFIVQSADNQHTSIIKAIKLGAEDYFVKSGGEEEGNRLFNTIERIINNINKII